MWLTSLEMVFQQRRIRFIVLTLFLLLVFFPAMPAKADMGIAPPSMHFTIEYQIHQTDIVQANLLICEDIECKAYQIFETVDYYSYGFPNFYCGGENDSEWCYLGIGNDDFRKYNRISLLFEDGSTRVSNVFKKRGYSSYYTVVVNEDALVVQEQVAQNWRFYNLFSPIVTICFLPAAIFTLIIETRVAKFYSKKLEKPIKHIILANILSLPMVWFIIPNWLELSFIWVFIIVELFAIVFEAIFIFYANRAASFTLKEGVMTSVIVNVASVGVGFLLIGILWLTIYLAT